MYIESANAYSLAAPPPFFLDLAAFDFFEGAEAAPSELFMKREKISLCLSRYSRRLDAGASGSVALLALVDACESF